MDSTDQPNQENTEEEEEVTSQAIRSYECNFCKRGFSNAQALGGHMNIHRKDKAKLKHQSSSSNEYHHDQPSLHHTPKISTTISPSISPIPPIPEFNKLSHKDIRNSIDWSWILDKDQNPNQRQQQEEQTSPELDLELRLGPEPSQGSSSPAIDTKRAKQ